MKKFEFRLASLLRLRETRLNMEQNKLQQLFAERKKLENNLRSISDERLEAERWIQNMSNPASADLRSLSSFLLGSKSREATLTHAISSCDEDIAEQRRKTLVAERDQKLLLNLKAKQKNTWQHDFEQELEEVAQEAWQSAARAKQKNDKGQP